MIACPYCHRRHRARELQPWGRGPVAIADCPPPWPISAHGPFAPVECDHAPCPECVWIRRRTDSDPDAPVELILTRPCDRHRRSA